MYTYFRTFIANFVFIILVPLIMARFTQSNWILVVYIPVYAFFELLFDFYHYDKLKKASRLRDKSDYKIGKAFIVQATWNTLLLICMGYCFALINSMKMNLDITPYIAMVIFCPLLLIALFSYIELFIDEMVYKDDESYVKRH